MPKPLPAPTNIGLRLPRDAARRLLCGRGRYTGDIVLPRMLHAVFLRSPYAHAEFTIDSTEKAKIQPGVAGIFTADDLMSRCQPMLTTLDHLPRHQSAVQWPLARKKASWQGEPIAVIVAQTRALAEDALEHVRVSWRELPAYSKAVCALAPESAPIHAKPDSNLALHFQISGNTAAPVARSVDVKRHFRFARHTGVPLEARAIVADFNPGDNQLSVYQSHQSPHLMQALYAKHLGLAEHKVRVICPDIGGAFGVKLHLYAEELTVATLACLLARPISYCSDRMEAFVSDAHAREFDVHATLSTGEAGDLQSISASLTGALGAFSIYPRSSIGDGLQGLSQCGAAYRLRQLEGEVSLAYQNKPPTGAYRGVGQPIACTVTELLVDDVAARLDIDPLALRARNYHAPQQPGETDQTTAGGLQTGHLSLLACQEKLVEIMAYDALRQHQKILRGQGIFRGIGVATFVEQTAVGANLYGPSGIPVTAQDGCVVSLQPSATVLCQVGCTDQGQGTLTGIAQIVADTLGIAIEAISIQAGDSDGPYGGGAWASRGLAICGEAAHSAALKLKARILALAAAVLQTVPESLVMQNGQISDRNTGQSKIALKDICKLAFFQQHLLPQGLDTDLRASSAHVTSHPPHYMANGIQGSYLEIDIETGFIHLLKHWVVEDCGRIVNPLLVEEQLRGGVVQGLGEALFEHCIYDEQAQLINGSLADYLVPMASEMPDIEIAHIETPQPGTGIGVKGVGEAGIIGAGAAVSCAVNDALRPFNATLSEQPFTPESVLKALGKI